MMRSDGLKRRRPTKSRLAVELLEDRTLLSAAAPVQVIDASSTDYDQSTILVRFRPEVSAPIQGGDILQGTAVGRVVADLLVPRLHEVNLAPGVSVPEALAAYNASPLVEYAEPNFHVYATDTIPNDPMWSQLNGMRRIQMPVAWDAWQGSGNTVVASIDTGVDYNHPDLAPNMWWGIGYNFVNNTPNPLDDNGHGSHTAGTMAAVGNNGVGVTGVNWYAQIMALKTLNAQGSGNLSWAISALNYAVNNGAHVSNNSYGCYSCYTQSFYNALVNADANYHVFVAAAGNNNRNVDTSPHYPASYNVGNVISVAATGSTNDARASFSNYGPGTVHLGAPGVNIRSTYRNGLYATASGTSQASPHVAGAMALMIDVWGYWGAPSDLRDWMLATTDYVGLPVISGGRLNVARMLLAAGPGSAPSGGGGGDFLANPFVGDPLVIRPLTETGQPILPAAGELPLTIAQLPGASGLPAYAALPQPVEAGVSPVRVGTHHDPLAWAPENLWAGW